MTIWHSPTITRLDASVTQDCSHWHKRVRCQRRATHEVSMMDAFDERYSYPRCLNHCAAWAHEHGLEFPQRGRKS